MATKVRSGFCPTFLVGGAIMLGVASVSYIRYRLANTYVSRQDDSDDVISRLDRETREHTTAKEWDKKGMFS